MATNTIQFRTPSSKVTTAAAPENTPLPSGLTAGDLMIMFRWSSSGQLDSTPTGWTVLGSGTFTSSYWALYRKTATSGDVSAGSVTMSSTAAGKRSTKVLAMFSAVGAAIITGFTTNPEGSTAVSAHSVAPIFLQGIGSVVSFLGLTDTSGAVSSVWQPPASMQSVGADTPAATGGVSQTVAAVAVNSQTTGDLSRGTFASSASWNVTDGTSGVTSTKAIGVLLSVIAVLRPTSDVTLPSGAVITGGSTGYGVTGDDDSATTVDSAGGTLTLGFTLGAGAPVPNCVGWDIATDSSASTTTVHAYLDRTNGTNVLDLGTDSTLITTAGYTGSASLAALSGTQKTTFQTDGGFRVRLVETIS